VKEERRGGRAWALVSVEDRGIGIPQEDLPHIFERFHRGRNVGCERLGTGIGLSGAKQIVEKHGGTIEVTSEEGAGSTFTVRLPLALVDIDADLEARHGE
jgi:signal transduction histidine kinase